MVKTIEMMLVAALVAGATSALADAHARQKRPADARAYAEIQAQGGFAGPAARATDPRNDVYVHGQYVGSDPDPFIRGELSRDVDKD